MKTMRKSTLFLTFSCFLLTYFFIQPVRVNFAQEMYPTRPIKYIGPTAAGGIIDVSSRKIAFLAAQYLGQEIIVENKPGAGTMLSASYIAKAKPDGYTIGAVTSAVTVIHPFFAKDKMDFDPIADFTPIVQFVEFNQALGVPINSPIKSFQEFLEEGRKRQIIIGGVGMTSAETAVQRLSLETKIKYKIVPFGGSAPTVMAAMGGQVDAFVCSGTSEFARAGKIKIIARLNGEPKKGVYKEIPTLKELGYDIEAVSFAGICGPKGLPEHIKKKLEEAFTRALEDPSVEQLIHNIGDNFRFRNSKDYTNYIKEVYKRTDKDMKELGLGIYAKDKK